VYIIEYIMLLGDHGLLTVYIVWFMKCN